MQLTWQLDHRVFSHPALVAHRVAIMPWEDCVSKVFHQDVLVGTSVVSTVPTAEHFRTACQPPWQLKCLDAKGSHTWASNKQHTQLVDLKPDVTAHHDADVASPLKVIHPGLTKPQTKKRIDDLRAKELVIIAGSSANPAIKLETLQQIQNQQQRALLSDWVSEHGLSLHTHSSMSAALVYQQLGALLPLDQAADAAHGLRPASGTDMVTKLVIVREGSGEDGGVACCKTPGSWSTHAHQENARMGFTACCWPCSLCCGM